MKPTLIVLFALCAATSIARAEDVVVLPAATVEQPSADAQAPQAVQARAAAERRQRMIDECIANHGYENDCMREVDTELRAEGARVIHLRAPH
ncbi:MAG TPA: hypothetical protein VEV21_01215 [Burkholderiales bacterium]|nr:hypothetical protein [Burkholderiales bacterium]